MSVKLTKNVTVLQVKYKEKYEKAKGHYMAVHDTPQILHAKSVAKLVSEVLHQYNVTITNIKLCKIVFHLSFIKLFTNLSAVQIQGGQQKGSSVGWLHYTC